VLKLYAPGTLNPPLSEEWGWTPASYLHRWSIPVATLKSWIVALCARRARPTTVEGRTAPGAGRLALAAASPARQDDSCEEDVVASVKGDAAEAVVLVAAAGARGRGRWGPPRSPAKTDPREEDVVASMKGDTAEAVVLVASAGARGCGRWSRARSGQRRVDQQEADEVRQRPLASTVSPHQSH
jgi:hypothetical protein